MDTTRGNADDEGGGGMRDIAKLLFGEDTGKLLGLFGGAGADGNDFGKGDRDESGAAGRVRRAAEWCGTTPGHGAAADAVRRTRHPAGGRPRAGGRGFRSR
jgi:hypothetical protein